MNRKGIAIPMVFILIIVLSIVVGSALYVSTIGVRSIGSEADKLKVRSIAEAGFNKAIWYLTTDPTEGGQGLLWRTEGVTEEYSDGNYSIIVEAGTGDEIFITSIGRYKNLSHTIKALAHTEFDDIFTRYTIFSQKDFEMLESALARGDAFADGNFTIKQLAKVLEGKIFVTSGHTIEGEGTFTEGELLDMPEVPSVDTTYYDNQIAVALAGGPTVVVGNPTYTDLDLNEATLYIDGNVILDGNIIGNGEIVTTGNIVIDDTANIGPSTNLIANMNITVYTGPSTTPTLQDEVVLYANGNITTQNGFVNTAPISMLADDNLTLGRDNEIYGVLSGGKMAIGDGTRIEGCIICGLKTLKHVLNSEAEIVYRKPAFTPPTGVPAKLVIDKYLQQ